MASAGGLPPLRCTLEAWNDEKNALELHDPPLNLANKTDKSRESRKNERFFAKNVLNMTNDIFEIYRRNMTDFRYDTYSVAEVKRQKINVHEETNFLSEIEMAAMKNAIKFVDDIAVKHARGMDEVFYADEMQKNVSKEFENILPNYERVLLDTRVVIREAWDFAKRCLTAEEMELFTKQMAVNYHVKNFGNWADEPLMDCGIVICD